MDARQKFFYEVMYQDIHDRSKKISNNADAQKPTRNGGGAGYRPQVHNVYCELHLSP